MSEKHSRVPDHSSAYDRVMRRLRDNLEQAEYKSWDYLQEKIEEAVEVELKAEEMTRDEMDLLTAYIKRDLKAMGYYTHETGKGIAAFLKFDLNVLEDKVAQLLRDLADRTRLQQEELRERLDHDENQYIAGELAAVGTLECLECGTVRRLLKTEQLKPCQACGNRYFRRVSD